MAVFKVVMNIYMYAHTCFEECHFIFDETARKMVVFKVVMNIYMYAHTCFEECHFIFDETG